MATQAHTTLLSALNVIDKESEKVLRKGLATRTFFLGLINLLVSAYLCGAFPESFWIVYATQGILILGYRFYVDITKEKGPSEIFHWFDFCWVANILLSSIAGITLLQVVDEQYQIGIIPNSHIADKFPQIGRVFCLFATGPLGWSIIALGNALVLHDIEHYSGCFIHMWPCLTTLSIRWNPSRVISRYPGFFDSLSGFQEHESPPDFLSLLKLGMSCYYLWWFPFTLWMLFSGRFHSPKETGKTTVYLDLVIKDPNCQAVVGVRGKTVEALETEAKQISAVLRYMFMHSFLVLLSMCFSSLCYQYQTLHLCFCVALILVAVINASKRYKWMLTQRYVRAMENYINQQFPEKKEEIKYRHKKKNL
jgi:hypothetical protein